jgi:hypothetical protein
MIFHASGKSSFHSTPAIPNDWFRKNDIDQFEGYYASVFYASFAALGMNIRFEANNWGRLDMAVEFT